MALDWCRSSTPWKCGGSGAGEGELNAPGESAPDLADPDLWDVDGQRRCGGTTRSGASRPPGSARVVRHGLPPLGALDPVLGHQPLDRAARALDPVAQQLPPRPPRPVARAREALGRELELAEAVQKLIARVGSAADLGAVETALARRLCCGGSSVAGG